MKIKRTEKSSLKSIGDILLGFDPLKDKYISREFQKYGYFLAEELGDLQRTSLYIKMAKEQPRAILEKALSFVKDSKARSKGRLFMWKMKELGAFNTEGKNKKREDIRR